MAKQQVLILLAALVFSTEAALHWNPTSFLDVDSPKVWNKNAMARFEPSINHVTHPFELIPTYPSEEDEVVNSKIKVSPIGMFSYLLRMADESKNKMRRAGFNARK